MELRSGKRWALSINGLALSIASKIDSQGSAYFYICKGYIENGYPRKVIDNGFNDTFEEIVLAITEKTKGFIFSNNNNIITIFHKWIIFYFFLNNHLLFLIDLRSQLLNKQCTIHN